MSTSLGCPNAKPNGFRVHLLSARTCTNVRFYEVFEKTYWQALEMFVAVVLNLKIEARYQTCSEYDASCNYHQLFHHQVLIATIAPVPTKSRATEALPFSSLFRAGSLRQPIVHLTLPHTDTSKSQVHLAMPHTDTSKSQTQIVRLILSNFLVSFERFACSSKSALSVPSCSIICLKRSTFTQFAPFSQSFWSPSSSWLLVFKPSRTSGLFLVLKVSNPFRAVCSFERFVPCSDILNSLFSFELFTPCSENL